MGIQDVSECTTLQCTSRYKPLYTHRQGLLWGWFTLTSSGRELLNVKQGGLLGQHWQPKKKKNPTQIQRKIIMNQSCFVYFLRIRSLSFLFKNSCRFKESCPIQTEAIAGTRKQFFIWSITLLCPSQEFQHCMIWRIVDSSKYSPKDSY